MSRVSSVGIDNLEMIWKEAVVDQSKYCGGICVEGLRKTSSVLCCITSIDIWEQIEVS
jgi:hypothetical protein